MCNDGLYRAYFPQTSIEGLSKEEALKEVEVYAEVLGYADAKVRSYALTADDLEHIRKTTSFPQSGPGCELDEYGFPSTYIPWEKQYEAYLFIYSKSINGHEIVNASTMNYLRLIYAREYGLIYTEISENLEPVESTKKEVNIMSKTEFIKHLCLQQNKQSVEALNITSIDLVYYSAFVDFDEAFNSISELRPAWRVVQGNTTEYCYDAITGNDILK